MAQVVSSASSVLSGTIGVGIVECTAPVGSMWRFAKGTAFSDLLSERPPGRDPLRNGGTEFTFIRGSEGRSIHHYIDILSRQHGFLNGLPISFRK